MEELSQSELEILVFNHFIEVSGLQIDFDTIEKRLPPEPDIFCFHKTEGPIYFELTELCSQEIASLINRSPEFGKRIYLSFESLPDDKKKQFNTKFNKPLSFKFSDSASRAKVVGRLPLVFEELIKLEISGNDNFTEFQDVRVSEILEYVRFAGRADSEGPNFNVAGSFWSADPSMDILLSKLAKKYSTIYPIDLLCYTAGRIITPTDMIIPTLKQLLESRDDTGAFRRFWFLGDNETELIYEKG